MLVVPDAIGKTHLYNARVDAGYFFDRFARLITGILTGFDRFSRIQSHDFKIQSVCLEFR